MAIILPTPNVYVINIQAFILSVRTGRTLQGFGQRLAGLTSCIARRYTTAMTTRLKTIIAVSLASLLLLAVLLHAQAPAGTTQTGRYQLISATYQNVLFDRLHETNTPLGSVSATDIQTVFKIDTSTGKVWFLLATSNVTTDTKTPVFQYEWRLTN